MISEKQQCDWQALVDWLSPQGNGACINALLEDGPDNTTDFAGLLRNFKEKAMKPEKESAIVNEVVGAADLHNYYSLGICPPAKKVRDAILIAYRLGQKSMRTK